MKRKLLIIIALIAVVFVTAVLWRVNAFVFGDRMNWAEAQARGQAVSMHQAILVELHSLERLVYSFNSDNFRKDRINWNALQPYYAVASLGLGTQGDVLTQTLFTKDGSAAARWNADYLNKALGRLRLNSAPGTQIYAKPFIDANKGHHVALIFVNASRGYALVGGGELFQSLIDAQKGSLSSFSVVTREGLTVGHSVPEYVGTLLTENPVYQAAVKSGASQGVGVLATGDGSRIFGLYDQVPGTNMWILSSAPMKDLMKGRASLLWQFLFLGAGLVLVGVGGMLFVIRPHEKSLQQLRQHALALVSGQESFKPSAPMTAEISEINELLSSAEAARANAAPVVVKEHVVSAAPPSAGPAVALVPPPANAPSVSVEDKEKNQREILRTKMEAYQRVASALGHEMRAPLTSILGYSQMILARTQDAEVVASVDSILRESRAARGVLEKLFSFAGEQDLDKNEMKVEGPLVRALKNLSSLIEQKGVQLEKDFAANSPIPLSVDELGRAFENILTNSVEALERMPRKELRVKLGENEVGVFVEISDSGEGIEAENIPRIFDPFFTTRSFQNHTGLGLAVALGILKEHQADVKVKSERGQGTTVEILFRKELPKTTTPPGPLAEEGLTLNESLPLMAEPVVEPHQAPQPLAAPPAAVAEAEELRLREGNAPPADLPPTEVNIDSLLDLPPEEAASAPAAETSQEEPPERETVIDEIPREENPADEEAEEFSTRPLAEALKEASGKDGSGKDEAGGQWRRSSQDEELSFIDGFMDDVKPAAAKSASPAASVPAAKPPAPPKSDAESVPAKESAPPAPPPAVKMGPPPPPPPAPPPPVEEDSVQALMDKPVDQEVPRAVVTAPQAPAPKKKSKLDEFVVNIPKPGKGS